MIGHFLEQHSITESNGQCVHVYC